MVLFLFSIRSDLVPLKSFYFLAMSSFSRGQFRQFVVWDFYTIVFLLIFIS